MKAGQLVKNTHLQSLAGNLLPAVLGLLAFMFLARGLSKVDFGSWVLYLSSFSLLEMIKSGGVQTALVMCMAGKDETQKEKAIGAAWILMVVIAVLSGLLLWAILPFQQPDWNPGLLAFLRWYPVIGLCTIPFNISQAILQSEHRFDRLFVLRFGMGLLLVGCSLVILFGQFSVIHVIIAHAAVQALCGVFLLVSGWSKALSIQKTSREQVRDMFRLGKFSFGTLAATNLLKSADTFLIGAFLGPAAVGMYSIPLRLTEVLEIPLRSAVATAFPRFSSLYNTGNKEGLRTAFYQYAGLTSWLFVPVLMGCFVLSDYLVVWLGGKEYTASSPIFRVFLCYGLFLPLDRFTGVLLDGLQKPSFNLLKVLVMAGFNVTGDIVVLHFFPDLRGVAFVSVCNAILGIILGFYLSRKYIDVRIRETVSGGWDQIRGFLRKQTPLVGKEGVV